MTNALKAILVVSVLILVIITAVFVLQRPRSEAQTTLSIYCGQYLDVPDCPAFVARIMAQSEAQVMTCYNQYPSYDARGTFYRCLEDAGVVPE